MPNFDRGGPLLSEYVRMQFSNLLREHGANFVMCGHIFPIKKYKYSKYLHL